jgi:hypothetical protein
VTKKKQSSLKTFNDWFALKMTQKFGSMGMFYLLVFYGLLPCIRFLAPFQNTFLYYSNFVQLISLPLLMVGQNLTGRVAEKRDQETHRLVKQSHDLLIQELKDIKETQDELAEIIKKLKTEK